MSYNGTQKYNWVYGKDGNIGLHNDLVNDVTWRYEYNLNGDLSRVVGNNDTEYNYTYDSSSGNLLTSSARVGVITKDTDYIYSSTGKLASIAYEGGSSLNYAYDGFDRIASFGIKSAAGAQEPILQTTLSYLPAVEENETTAVIDAVKNIGNGWSERIAYTYDKNGNIRVITVNGYRKVKYYYDELNQLIREENKWLNKTITYTYDNGGNILAVNEYDYTTGSVDDLTPTATKTYTYTSSNWRDKLTYYNGNRITYDAIGNPLTYFNGFSFTWQDGRKLAGISGNGLTASYKYDADGSRTQKTINGVTTDYTLEGSTVIRESNGTDTIWYNYDSNGSLVSFDLNGTMYYYIKNQQGDIIAIADSAGAKVVEYTYDSWGKLISTSGSLASTVGIKNPYRYREYRYDTETGLYYLQSRYYDPEMKRFINADIYVDTGDTVLGTNMFAYCLNNPINMSDTDGLIPAWVITGIKNLALLGAGPHAWVKYHIAKGIISAAGIGYLSKKGYSLSRAMFNHGMWCYGKSPSASIRNLLIKRLKSSSIMRGTISNIMRKAKGNSISKKIIVEFKTGNLVDSDLYYSLQHATIKIKGRKRNGVWYLTINASDTYNFDNIRSFSKLSFGNAANDLGWYMQRVGMMIVYKINVSYNITWR